MVGDDGRTPYERRKGRKFKRELPELGECVRYIRPESVGQDKANSRWEDGVYVGLRIESGELFVMTAEGVIKIRSYCRKPEDERWKKEDLESGRGLPWEPIPGRGRIQVKSRVKFMEASGEKIREPFEWEEPKRRGIYISREDVKDTYGAVEGCRGCQAALRGEEPRAHNARCRAMKEKQISEK